MEINSNFNEVCISKSHDSSTILIQGGLRLQGSIKEEILSLPLVTVVTVVYNGADVLAETIKSVLTQTYENIEYIIVDGGSTDGTLKIIQSYNNYIDYWVSEKDEGIYDAMNKAQILSTGDFVWYLNAGDTISAADVMKRVFDDGGIHDYYYGNTQLINSNGYHGKIVYAPVQITATAMYRGMIVSHQSIIFRRSLMAPYDQQYKFIADQKWVIDGLMRSRSGVHVGLVLSNYLLGGISDQYSLNCIIEKIKLAINDLPFEKVICLLPLHFFQILKVLLKKLKCFIFNLNYIKFNL